MPCVICGATPTVKSHIIPRSLFRHGLAPGRQVVGSMRAGPGHQHLQSGFWDSDILCAAHEATFQVPDDYAARVVRATMTSVGPDDVTTLCNPTPRHLVLFAAACVWRMAVSRSNGRPERMLGPYAERLQKMIFEGSDFDPMLLVSRSAYRNGDQHLGVGVLPHRYKELGIGFWRFVAAGLVFDIKLDNRAAPPEMRTLAVNAAEEFPLFPDIPVDVRADRPLFASLARMAAPRRRGPT